MCLALSVSIYINLQIVLVNDPFSDLDTISLSSSLTITNQSIGAASSSQDFENVDGLLDLGPKGLTYGTLTKFQDSEHQRQLTLSRQNIVRGRWYFLQPDNVSLKWEW